jgi:hypothetical protein
VVAVAPDGTAPTENAVHRPCDTDREAVYAAAQCACVIRLDDEMDVILLNAELQDPEPAMGGGGERAANGGKDPAGTQAVYGLAGAERDMRGVHGAVRCPSTMRNARATSRSWLAPGTSTTASPGARSRKRKLQVASHLDSAMIAD